MMNSRERISKILRGDLPDRLAHGEFFISDEFVRAFHALDADASLEWTHRQSVIEQLDLDIAPVSFSEGWGALDQPDPDRALDALMRWRDLDRFAIAVMDGPFSAAVRTRGFNEMMHAIHGAPHVARDAFARGADDMLVVVHAAHDAGADGILFGEDIAYGRQTYVSPDALRNLLFPELHRLVRATRDLGLAVLFHSDGNLNAILADLIACEFDGLQGLEPDAQMDVVSTRARVGDALTLWGNLSYDFLAGTPSDDELRAEINHLRGNNRKFILGSCGGLVAGMNGETVRRVHRLAKSLAEI
jgi:uroporphyrinogen decarboxylase